MKHFWNLFALTSSFWVSLGAGILAKREEFLASQDSQWLLLWGWRKLLKLRSEGKTFHKT